MARMRYIKPQFFLNEDLGTIPKLARYLYIGLWCLSDDRGVFEWKPARIRIQIFPYDTDVSTENINDWLNSLIKLGDIVQFTEKGNDYGYLVNFRKHQLIKNPSKWTFTDKLPDGYPVLPQSYPSPTPVLPVGSREGGIGNRDKGKRNKALQGDAAASLKSYFYSFKRNGDNGFIDEQWLKFIDKYPPETITDGKALIDKWFQNLKNKSSHKSSVAAGGNGGGKKHRSPYAGKAIMYGDELLTPNITIDRAIYLCRGDLDPTPDEDIQTIKAELIKKGHWNKSDEDKYGDGLAGFKVISDDGMEGLKAI